EHDGLGDVVGLQAVEAFVKAPPRPCSRSSSSAKYTPVSTRPGEIVARLHSMRLAKAAESAPSAAPWSSRPCRRPWRITRSQKSTGGASGPTIRSNASCARFVGATRVVGAFPDGNSAINLAAARLRHIAGTRWSTKGYLNMELLRQRNAKI